MILTPHAIVGATLANIFPSEPALGFGLAFASHYVLDMIPHTDYDISNFINTDTKTIKSIFKSAGASLHLLFIIIDFVVAIFLCVLLFVRDDKSLLLTAIGVVGGLLPDLFQFIYCKYKNQPWIFFQKIHDKLHHIIKAKNEKLWGIFLLFAIPIFSLIFYFILLPQTHI